MRACAYIGASVYTLWAYCVSQKENENLDFVYLKICWLSLLNVLIGVECAYVCLYM